MGDFLLTVVHGEPHLTTLDGHSYDLQAVGEFVHVDTPTFEVQFRFEGSKGRNTGTNATAVRAGAHVLESYFTPPWQRPETFSVIIDGSVRELDFKGLSFDDGTFVARRHGGYDDNVLIVDPIGSYVVIENLFVSQNLVISLAGGSDVRGGLGGVPDGNTSNDFTLRDGTVLPLSDAQTIEGLYGQFAASWRVRREERLFTRGTASDFLTEEYTSLPKAITKLSDFSGAEVEEARRQCLERGIESGVLLNDCAYDVVVTGNLAWADQAATSAAAWSLSGNTPSVVRNAVNLEAPQSIAAGSALQFAWQGPDASDDLIFIASPDMAVDRYPLGADHRHKTEEGSPAQLVAPAEPGRYEIRYFSGANGTVLARSPLTVTNTEARLDAPGTVAAGSAMQFAWQGPDAPGDLIFIASLDMAANRFPLGADRRHKTEEGSPAQLVAPAEPGRYEIRYFSRANGTVLARFSLRVINTEVRLDAPGTVAAGSAMQFAWQGPDAPGDLIFIASPDMAANRFPLGADHRHKTKEGSPAQLVAPAEPGRYEIRYFSRANGTVLARSPLTVR